jgi:hypothetical protein
MSEFNCTARVLRSVGLIIALTAPMMAASIISTFAFAEGNDRATVVQTAQMNAMAKAQAQCTRGVLNIMNTEVNCSDGPGFYSCSVNLLATCEGTR